MTSCHDSPSILRSADSIEVLRINRAFTERLGLTAEDLAEHTLLGGIAPEDRDEFERTLQAGTGTVRARHRTGSGEWIPLTWCVKTYAGQAFAHGSPEDVPCTDERTPEDEGVRPLQTMSETLDNMARTVEAKNPGMMCSILLVDSESEYIVGGAGPSLPAAYNRAVEGLRIGPSVGSCGTAAFWNMPVVVEDISRDPHWESLRDVAALAGVAACWSQPITAANGDVLGAMALYSAHASAPTRDQMDGLEIAARMVGLAVERNRLEEQLHQAAKMEALGVLAGGIAHDFNNMLTAILGNAELAAETLPANAEAREMLHEIVNASVNATGLCSQMLAYAGRGAMAPETIECNTLVRELGGLLRAALSKKATLSYDLHAVPLGIQADRNQIRQVLMNLITNASEAIGNRSGKIVIGTSVRKYTEAELGLLHAPQTLAPGEYVRLRVRDTGAGLSTEIQGRIFDPFFTTKATGRGLGLAAVRGIVASHGGAITLESEEGLGTTFEVLLPRFALRNDWTPTEPAAEHAAGTADAPAAHILVVDDEPQVRAVLVDILEREGYSVTWACDGREALELFRNASDTFDAVLLDLSMPELGGDEVFRELREIKQDVRVILSSGFAEQQILDRFRDTGLMGVVQKPAQRHVLLAKVAEALDQPAP